ncbi:MAG: hypothetical protein NW205_08330 [Hyphomicrobiaceae bacterium]|nr:hypothetical protein [Hyphomicrobiaceae bacterium]
MPTVRHGAAAEPRHFNTAEAAGDRRRRWLDAGERAFALIALAVSVGAGIWQARIEEEKLAGQDRAAAARSWLAAAPPAAELMIAGYAGAPYTYPSLVRVRAPEEKTDLTVDPVTWRGEPFNDPIYYGVRVVRWLGEGRTGAMLDFTHSKAIAELGRDVMMTGTERSQPVPSTNALNAVFKRLEFSHGHNMLTLNGLMRLVDLHPALSLYGGLGVGINLPHTEVQRQSGRPRTYEYQYTGPVAQGLIGIEFRVPRMSYFIEYKFTFASYDAPLSELDGTKIGLFADLYRQAAMWWSGTAPPGGHVETRLVSHEVIGGLGVRFGAPGAAAP